MIWARSGTSRALAQNTIQMNRTTQISSVQEALRAVARALMRNHLSHCATHAFNSGSAEDREAMYDELLDIIYKNAR